MIRSGLGQFLPGGLGQVQFSGLAAARAAAGDLKLVVVNAGGGRLRAAAGPAPRHWCTATCTPAR
jgi:hypothetical protein